MKQSVLLRSPTKSPLDSGDVDECANECAGECVVCFNTLPMAKKAFKCSHAFCEDCTKKVLAADNPVCPYCRAYPTNFTPPRRITMIIPTRPHRRREGAEHNPRGRTLDFSAEWAAATAEAPLWYLERIQIQPWTSPDAFSDPPEGCVSPSGIRDLFF